MKVDDILNGDQKGQNERGGHDKQSLEDDEDQEKLLGRGAACAKALWG
jgi:hypothetical protein